MKRLRMVCMVTLVAFTGIIQVSHAATEDQKRIAINAALEWLAQQQQSDGRWEQGGAYPSWAPGVTGVCLQAFMNKGYAAGTDVIINSTNYGDVVGDGLNYLFSRARRSPVSIQRAGDPDTNGNGIGIYFPYSADYQSYYAFNSSMAIAAIVLTGTPNAIVTTGSETGRTYADVVQDAVDYLAWAQTDVISVYCRGGWRYTPNYNSSDQEFTPWVAMAMKAAEQNWDITVPPFVKSETRSWTDYIQYVDGSAGYTGPTVYRNAAHTAGLLMEISFVESDLNNVPDILNNSKVLSALTYLNNWWLTGDLGDVYNGHFGQPYAMWRCYVALKDWVGLDDTTWIANLRGSGMLDPCDSANWYEDYCEYLVQNQSAAGYWNESSGYWRNTLTTAWFVDILSLSYDLDLDGSIGLGDLQMMCENWLSVGVGLSGGDFYKDENDIVNFLDFSCFANMWGD